MPDCIEDVLDVHNTAPAVAACAAAGGYLVRRCSVGGQFRDPPVAHHEANAHDHDSNLLTIGTETLSNVSVRARATNCLLSAIETTVNIKHTLY